MKNFRQIAAALIALFLLTACTDKAGDAADRANADAERARKAFSEAFLASTGARLKKAACSVPLITSRKYEQASGPVGAAALFADEASAAHDKAESAARKASHAAESGLTDRALEAAFDASEAAIEAEQARDGAVAMREILFSFIREAGGDPDSSCK